MVKQSNDLNFVQNNIVIMGRYGPSFITCKTLAVKFTYYHIISAWCQNVFQYELGTIDLVTSVKLIQKSPKIEIKFVKPKKNINFVILCLFCISQLVFACRSPKNLFCILKANQFLFFLTTSLKIKPELSLHIIYMYILQGKAKPSHVKPKISVEMKFIEYSLKYFV